MKSPARRSPSLKKSPEISSDEIFDALFGDLSASTTHGLPPEPADAADPAARVLDFELTKLALDPSDLLLVRVPLNASGNTIAYLANELYVALGQQRFIVYRADLEFSVVRDHAGILNGFVGGAAC